MSYQRICVAVDGSETAEQALVAAAELARSLQANLAIVHVADIPAFNIDLGMDFQKYIELIRSDSQDILDRMLLLAEKHGIKAEPLLIENTASTRISQKITEQLQSWKADLLVIGSHGYRGFRRFILGSVAEDVMRITTVPILLIRAQNSVA